MRGTCALGPRPASSVPRTTEFTHSLLFHVLVFGSFNLGYLCSANQTSSVSHNFNMTTTFRYDRLILRMPIRILILQPGRFFDPIHIELQQIHIPLGNKYNRYHLQNDEQVRSTYLEYEALSYVWGSTDNQKPIFIDGEPDDSNVIMVTENLDIALRHLRNPSTTRTLWVDAVCIDQSNDAEKSTQVAFMGNVFARALRVIVWLGPEGDDSNRAMELLDYIGRRFEVNYKDFSITPSELERNEPSLSSMNTPLPISIRDQTLILLLFRRPWFSRLWVRQEIAMSHQAVLQCGTATIDWLDFCPGASVVCTTPFIRGLEAERSLVFCLTLIKGFTYAPDVIRYEWGPLQCSEVQDHIYAIQDLLDSRNWVEQTPDYSIEPGELFTRICQQLVKQLQTTSFLISCELSSISLPNLPTWVPDWSCPLRARHRIAYPWSGCAWISSHAKYIGSRMLRVSGVQVAHVGRVCHFGNEGIKFSDIMDTLAGVFKVKSETSEYESSVSQAEVVVDHCLRVISDECLKENWWPTDNDRPNLTQIKKELLQSRRRDGSQDWDGFYKSTSKKMMKYMRSTEKVIVGRGFFSSTEGNIGLAPRDTREGDIVCVVLGCSYPIALRPTSSNGTKWKVIGPCFVPGFMNGEAIYRTLPGHYRAVNHKNGPPYIDGYNFGMLDARTQELKTNPAEILAEFGIRATRYQRDPHILEVTPESLRDAGVDLQEFDLI